MRFFLMKCKSKTVLHCSFHDIFLYLTYQKDIQKLYAAKLILFSSFWELKISIYLYLFSFPTLTFMLYAHKKAL